MVGLVVISTVSSHCSIYCFASCFYSDAILNAQSRELAVAEFARCYSTHLTEFFRFSGIKQFEFCHFAIPRGWQ